MTSKRIEEIQNETDYPRSISVQQALLQVWNECGRETEYWKIRCELAEKVIEECPCDPDITSGQIIANSAYQGFITSNFL